MSGMALGMNIIMAVFATISFLLAVSFFFREREVGRIRWFILFMGLGCGLSNLGYMLMSVTDPSAITVLYRNIGLFGLDFYLYMEFLLILDQINKRISYPLKKFLVVLVGVITILDMLIYGWPSNVHFESVNGFTVFVNDYFWCYYFHTAQLVLRIILLLVVASFWFGMQKTKRGRNFVIFCFISNFAFGFSSFPYFLGVEVAHPAFAYCLGNMVAFVVMWYAGILLSGFNVTAQSLSNDIFASINVGFLVFDENGELILRNECAKSVLHLPGVNRQRIHEIFEVSVEEENQTLQEVMEKGGAQRHYRLRKEDKSFTVDFTLKRDRLKEPLCILCVVNDVTKEEKMIAEVVSANEAKSNFLASMSHEIRTPINAVLGMNEMIIRESREPDIVNYALDVENSGRMLLSLINDILDFSKIESGKMEIVPVEYELASLVNDILNMMRVRAEEKGLQFLVEVDEKLPGILFGDEVRIRQIMVNLLSNAIKYTEKGTVKLSLYGERREEGLDLFILVSDTGKGIREEDQKRLFESFTRVDEVENRSIEGTGLGLALTQSFVTMMEGELTLQSKYHEGSTFTARVRQQIVNEESIGDFTKKIEENRAQNKHETRIFAPDCKVLVVDDVPMNCKVFCGFLKGTGIRIDCAMSGKEALEKCQSKKYDLIFMDHRMPVMDGVECFHVLREMESVNRDTKVIILTANAIAGMREQYLKEGFCDYLTKPINIKYLEEAFRHHVPQLLKTRDEKNPEWEENGEERPKDIKEGAQVKEEGTTRKLLPPELGELNESLGLVYCMDNQELFFEMLKEYGKDDRSTLMEECIEQGDYKKFRTNVHALKSASLYIGADVLSEKAKKLEHACDHGDTEFVLEHAGEFIRDYRGIVEKIRRVFDL